MSGNGALPAPLSRTSAATGAGQPIVVVLGMHRSGTSLCSQVLSGLGVYMADEVGANEWNPTGHWERWEIVAAHDRILGLLKRDYFSPYHDCPLPAAWWARPDVRAIRLEIEDFMISRMRPNEPFGFKDPRTVRMLPIWRQIFNNLSLQPKFVVCVRQPGQVVASLRKRDGQDRRAAEYRWLVYNAECFAGPLGEHIVIDYGDWFSSPDETLLRLQRFLTRNAAAPHVGDLDEVRELISLPRGEDRPDRSRGVGRAVSYFYDLIRRPDPGGQDMVEICALAKQFLAFQQTSPLERVLTDADRRLVECRAERDAAADACRSVEAALADVRAAHAEALRVAESQGHEHQAELARRSAEQEQERSGLRGALADAETRCQNLTLAAAAAASRHETDLRALVAANGDEHRRLQASLAAAQAALESAAVTAAERDAELEALRERLADAAAGLAPARAPAEDPVKVVRADADPAGGSAPDARPGSDGEMSSAFDREYYLDRYLDVMEAGIEPLTHYRTYGEREGRRPAPYFDPDYYRSTYPDVDGSGLGPFEHYLKIGRTEGRQAIGPGS